MGLAFWMGRRGHSEYMKRNLEVALGGGDVQRAPPVDVGGVGARLVPHEQRQAVDVVLGGGGDEVDRRVVQLKERAWGVVVCGGGRVGGGGGGGGLGWGGGGSGCTRVGG